VFGPGRLMVGSDWPVCTLAASYGDVWALAGTLVQGVPDPERDAICGGTAARVYRL
jgi:L-fuconolactonase